jgi:hypothetical protein
MKFKYCLLSFILIFSIAEVTAQGLDIKQAYENDIKIRKTGMAILGTWAIGNMIVGGIGRSQFSGETAYFHEMNLIWNVVNVGIAGAGYYFSSTAEIPAGGAALLSDQIFFQKTLLFNAGLDLAYIAGGFYLMERAKNTTKKPERLRGYGKSVIMQGAFLFVFDVILHTVHVRKTNEVADFLSHLYLSPNQVGVVFGF